MNDVSSRVVDDAVFEQKTAAPDAECADGIGESEPERDEDHPCCEIHTAEKGSSDQNERDSREDELKIHHRSLRELLCQGGCWQIRVLQFET